MKRLVPFLKVALVVAVVCAVLFGPTADAKTKPKDGPCHPDIFCPAVWDPVICADGKIYSNACYAYVWCQTDCESLGEGPVEL